MLIETMSVAEVAQLKGVSEAAIRFAVNDPQNTTLRGVKHGGRLMILADSVAAYTPRTYPRMERMMQIADAHETWMRRSLENLAAEMVEEHPLAARVVRSSFTSGRNGLREHGVPKMSPGLVLEASDDLRLVDPNRVGPMCLIDWNDDENAFREKVRAWALRLVDEGYVAMA